MKVATSMSHSTARSDYRQQLSITISNNSHTANTEKRTDCWRSRRRRRLNCPGRYFVVKREKNKKIRTHMWGSTCVWCDGLRRHGGNVRAWNAHYGRVGVLLELDQRRVQIGLAMLWSVQTLVGGQSQVLPRELRQSGSRHRQRLSS